MQTGRQKDRDRDKNDRDIQTEKRAEGGSQRKVNSKGCGRNRKKRRRKVEKDSGG